MLMRILFLTFFFAFSLGLKKPIEPVTISPFPICAVRCAAIGSPQCSIRNGVLQLFSSNCAKMGHYCNTGETWETVNMANCFHTICPIACSGDDTWPVCATNGSVYQKFPTPCDFMNYACQHHTEEWNRVMDQDCPLPMP